MYARRNVRALFANASRCGVRACGWPPIGPIQSFMSSSEMTRMLGGEVRGAGELQEPSSRAQAARASVRATGAGILTGCLRSKVGGPLGQGSWLRIGRGRVLSAPVPSDVPPESGSTPPKLEPGPPAEPERQADATTPRPRRAGLRRLAPRGQRGPHPTRSSPRVEIHPMKQRSLVTFTLLLAASCAREPSFAWPSSG